MPERFEYVAFWLLGHCKDVASVVCVCLPLIAFSSNLHRQMYVYHRRHCLLISGIFYSVQHTAF